MPLRGLGFLALWNDFDPAREAEYECWHTFEHVPERVGIPGFLSGRRYRAAERNEDRYFTLYDLESLAALDGPGYADVVNCPTPWSLAMRPSFRKFHRAPCRTLATFGLGTGGCIGTIRFEMSGDGLGVEGSSLERLSEMLLATEGITSLHLGRVDQDSRFPLQRTPLVQQAGSTGYVMLLEGTSRTGLDISEGRLREALLPFGSLAGTTWGTFDLAFLVERSDLGVSGARQPPRDDLRRRHEAGKGGFAVRTDPQGLATASLKV
jgi:hypothetical protein